MPLNGHHFVELYGSHHTTEANNHFHFNCIRLNDVVDAVDVADVEDADDKQFNLNAVAMPIDVISNRF